MKLLKQPSFRRIMLLRILLVSIPILLIGVAVAFRKARTSLLYTARQNLKESAIRKAENLESSIHALQVSLVAESETLILRTGELETSQQYLAEIAKQFPSDAWCLQLSELDTANVVARACGKSAHTLSPPQSIETLWPTSRETLSNSRFYIQTLNVDLSTPPSLDQVGSHLDLVIETPVYGLDNQPQYVLSAYGRYTQIESAEPGSLLGYTMVVREDGTVLAHPFAENVGLNISELGDAERFESILRGIVARGENADVRHLFNFSRDNREWLAGYSPVNISISSTQDETWVVFAVTPLDHALHGLKDIKRILIILTGVLLSAHLLAMLYTARDLARPIEQLGKYAQSIHAQESNRAPRDFHIREINQLASVLELMVHRLEERADELEAAWQEAEAANQLKNEFLANTSHELRTPLNAIIGCIRLIKDDCCDDREEELEFLERADEAAIHLLKIINDLLDIAKIEAGSLSLSMEEVDVGTMLKNVIDLQTVEAHQKSLWLTVPHLPDEVIIRADPAKLKQVFLNIIYNAIKFTDQGGITISTRIEYFPQGIKPTRQTTSADEKSSDTADTQGCPWITIAVADTGIGIDPSQQHKLFRPFVMVDGSTTRKFEGTGLGLAISKNLVDLMDGTITLYSDGMGRGTTVEIALPVIRLATQKLDHTPSSNGSLPDREASPPKNNRADMQPSNPRGEQTIVRQLRS